MVKAINRDLERDSRERELFEVESKAATEGEINDSVQENKALRTTI